MSDHIDDSTTDHEIEATVMRDKLKAVASPQATRPERICGNCGLPLVQGETEEMCRELDKVAARLEAKRAAQPAAGTTPHEHKWLPYTRSCSKCGQLERLEGEATTPQAERPTLDDDLLLVIAEQIGEVERDMIGDSVPPSIITDIIRKAVRRVPR